MQWSTEKYRLDEVTNKFDLPCVIYVTEGYYSETDAESISAGDIIRIDKAITLHKVAANFANDCDTIHSKTLHGNDEYVDLKEREILVPLNYNGKLKVKTDFKQYDSVFQLSKELPRYAKLRSNIVVTTDEGKKEELRTGQVIELDRIIPANNDQVDKLVIQFKRGGSSVFAFLPTNMKGHFRTEPDDNEYTLKETIDRYKLPQVISFIDDEIKRVYTPDLVEGIENMKTITETLRLNRLVSQNVLVGHYKPLEDAEADTAHFCQRTLVVLPLELTDIKEIEVHVLQGATDEDYEDIFLVRNVSHGLEVVDGSLYVDFALKPGVKRFANGIAETGDQGDHTDKGHQLTEKPEDKDEPPPPVPFRPRRPVKPVKPTTNMTVYKDVTSDAKYPYKDSKAGEMDDDSQDDDYIYPDQPSAPPSGCPLSSSTDDYTDMTYSAATSPGFSLADMDFKADIPEQKKRALKYSKSNIKDMVKSAAANIRTKLKSTSKDNKDTTVTTPKQQTPSTQASQKGPLDLPTDSDSDEDDGNLYDYPDEKEIMALKKYDTPPTRQTKVAASTNTRNERPVAHVTPQSIVTKPEESVKPFFDLDVTELEERLSVCGMSELAKVCKHHRLDGNFMQHVSNEELHADPFKLGTFQVSKLGMIRNDWIPK